MLRGGDCLARLDGESIGLHSRRSSLARDLSHIDLDLCRGYGLRARIRRPRRARRRAARAGRRAAFHGCGSRSQRRARRRHPQGPSPGGFGHVLSSRRARSCHAPRIRSRVAATRASAESAESRSSKPRALALRRGASRGPPRWRAAQHRGRRRWSARPRSSAARPDRPPREAGPESSGAQCGLSGRSARRRACDARSGSHDRARPRLAGGIGDGPRGSYAPYGTSSVRSERRTRSISSTIRASSSSARCRIFAISTRERSSSRSSASTVSTPARLSPSSAVICWIRRRRSTSS